jgi:hypothetical protein
VTDVVVANQYLQKYSLHVLIGHAQGEARAFGLHPASEEVLREGSRNELRRRNLSQTPAHPCERYFAVEHRGPPTSPRRKERCKINNAPIQCE